MITFYTMKKTVEHSVELRRCIQYFSLLHTRKAFSLTILTKKTAGRILPYGPCHTVYGPAAEKT